MNKIILASNNKHKITEFREIFSDCEILSLSDIGFFDEIEENGTTFAENSLIKAKAVSVFIKNKGIVANIIADDSGLWVDALNGEPGIFSARYSESHNDKSNREKLLKNLENKTNRKAYFCCTLVELFPDGKYLIAEGKTYGKITTQAIGDTSFGYDCLFFSNELNKTFGEATCEEKNNVSHRKKAIEKLMELRKKSLN